MPTGDGSYVAVDIPFVSGQEESFDRKILPVGPLRKVLNAFQERTGRWTERRVLADRQLTTVEGVDVGACSFRSTLPEDYCALHYRGNGRVAYFGNRVDDTEFVRVAGGEYGGFGFLGQYFAAGFPSSKTDGVTFSPSVAKTDRHLIFAFISAGKITDSEPILGELGQPYHINVLWYDINTLRVLRVESFQPTGQPDDIALEAKVVAAEAGGVMVAVNTRQGGSTGNGLLRLYTWSGIGAVRADGASIDIRAYSTFDIASTGAWYWLCYCSNTNVITLQRRSNTLLGSTATYALPTAPSSNTRTVYCSVACRGLNDAIGIGATNGITGQQVRIRYVSGTLVSGHQSNINGTCAAYPGYMGHDVSLFWAGFTKLESAALDGGVGLDGLVPVKVNDNAFVVGHPIISNTVVGKLADARGYVPIVGAGLYKRLIIDYTVAGGLVTPGNTAAYDHFDGSAEALVRFGREDLGIVGSVGGMLARAGGMLMERVQDIDPAVYNFMPKVPKTTAARPIPIGEKYWVVPVEQNFLSLGQKDTFVSAASFVVLEHEHAIGSVSGLAWDRKNALMSGAALHAVDDQALFFAGFTDRPIIEVTFSTANPPGTNTGPRDYILVAEYRDAAGRLWRSAPSQPVTTVKDGATLSNRYLYAPAGSPAGTRLVLYGNQAGGTIFYQHSSYPAPGFLARDTTDDADLIKGAPIYTAGGVLENSAPPACRFLVRTRDRVWAGLLDYPARVQSSKFIRPTEGVHWSNADQFFVDIPHAVTGLAGMDDVLVVFTQDAIYLVHGDGPTDLGVGAYGPPQRIPTDVGCMQARSIVTDSNGVYFLSRRGLELLSRGFSAPVFVGDSVRDTVSAHPFCLDSALYQSDKTVRWLFSNVAGNDQSEADQVILVLDTRSGAWSTYESSGLHGIGRATGVGPDYPSEKFPPDGMSIYSPLPTGFAAQRETILPEGQQWLTVWETGEIRPAGLLAGALGRTLNILGTYRSPVDITIQMAFDDAKDWHPTWVKTWSLTDAAYADGDAVTLELTLPQQKFQAARFRLYAVRQTQKHPGFDAHGVTVYFDTEGSGPRRTIGRSQKG